MSNYQKKYGICELSIVPARSKPSDKREMVTQILFGEYFEILDEDNKWYLSRLAGDGYECWVDKKQVKTISKTVFNKLKKATSVRTTDLAGKAVRKKDGSEYSLVQGSLIPFYNGKTFKLGNDEYTYEGGSISPEEPSPDLIKNHALRYLNTPYLWGGKSPFGIDCSGLVQMVCILCGVDMPRDAHQQVKIGKTLTLIDETKEGDLAFFSENEKRITHVGIILAGNEIIHASGRVRIDKLDHQGIFNDQTKEYSHRLRLLKRIF